MNVDFMAMSDPLSDYARCLVFKQRALSYYADYANSTRFK